VRKEDNENQNEWEHRRDILIDAFLMSCNKRTSSDAGSSNPDMLTVDMYRRLHCQLRKLKSKNIAEDGSAGLRENMKNAGFSRSASLQSAIAKAEKEQLLVNDSIITEARALLSSMIKKELKAATERAKEKKDLSILESAIAEAEKEQLVDALSIDLGIDAAKAQIPVVAKDELTAAIERAKEKKTLSILESAIAKAEKEELVDALSIDAAKAQKKVVAKDELRVVMQGANMEEIRGQSIDRWVADINLFTSNF